MGIFDFITRGGHRQSSSHFDGVIVTNVTPEAVEDSQPVQLPSEGLKTFLQLPMEQQVLLMAAAEKLEDVAFGGLDAHTISEVVGEELYASVSQMVSFLASSSDEEVHDLMAVVSRKKLVSILDAERGPAGVKTKRVRD